MRIVVLVLFFISLYSCGDAASQEPKKESKPWTQEQSLDFIRDTRTQLMGMPTSTDEQLTEMYKLRDLLIDSMEIFVKNYPDHEKNMNLFANLYLMYSSKNDHTNGLRIGDVIIKNYPKFPDRKMILQGQIDFCLNYLKPFDKKRVATYYQILVEEDLETDSDIAAENKKMLERFSAE